MGKNWFYIDECYSKGMDIWREKNPTFLSLLNHFRNHNTNHSKKPQIMLQCCDFCCFYKSILYLIGY